MGRKNIFVIMLSGLLLISTGVFVKELSDYEEPSRMTIFQPGGFGDFEMGGSSFTNNEHWQNLVESSLFSNVVSPIEESMDRWAPELADSLPDFLEQSDGTYIVSLNLKPNLKFASGNDITVEDVIFSYKLYLTFSISYDYSFLRKYFENNNSITSEGNTLYFHLTQYDDNAIYVFDLGIVEKAVYQPIYESCEQGDNVDCVWQNNNVLDRSSNVFYLQGAGPYKIKWYKNETIEELLLEKNPYYWDSENVLINEIYYKSTNKISTALSFVDNSTIDLFSSLYKLNSTTFDPYPELKLQLISSYEVHFYQLNHYHPIFGSGVETPIGKSDPSQSYNGAKYVRQALAHLVDRDRIVEDIYDGLGRAATTIVPYGSFGYNDILEPYPYDIEIAKSFMEKAGYDYSLLQDTDDNGLYDNSFFNLTLLTPDTNEQRIEWSSQLPIEAAKIGINIDNSIEDWDTIWGHVFIPPFNPPDTSDQGGYDLLSIGTKGVYKWDPNDDYSKESLLPNDGSNTANYVNSSLHNLVQNYYTETDTIAKIVILKEIQNHFWEEVVQIPVIYPLGAYGTHCRMDGIEDLLRSAGQPWKGIKIDYSSCPNGVKPAFIDDLMNSPAIYLILPGTASGLILLGLLVNVMIQSRVTKEIRQLPAKEKAMTRDYLEKARKIAEQGGDIEEDQYPEDFSDVD